jgi:uridine kinase
VSDRASGASAPAASDRPSRELAAVVERLAERIVALPRPHPMRVAIDGRSAAGKTTLADALAASIQRRGQTVIRASVDDFQRPRAERYRRGRLSPEGYYLDGFDYPALRRALLLPLGPGGDRRYRAAVFDSLNDTALAGPVREAVPDAILLVDGVFLFRPEIDDCWDFRIFVDADPTVAYQRGVKRDQGWMGSRAAAQERYQRRYLPGEQLYLDAVRPQQKANVVLDNTDLAAPRLRWNSPAASSL